MKRTLESVLADIRNGKGPSLLLLHGDDYRVHSAGRAILDLLVPPEKRDFNLERFDGRAAPWDEIEAALMTPPFFSGAKTVVIENAPYFFSREQRGELGAKVLQLWGEGKKEEAARLLVDLLLLEGWTQERWEGLKGPSAAGRLAALLGGEEREVVEQVEALLAFCHAGGMNFTRPKGGEGQRLMELLERGLPPWDILLIIASQVDRRTRLYKGFGEKGWVLDLTVEKDRAGRISRELLAEFLDRRLKEVGKRVEVQAREMILERAGEELWAVHQELEKLFLYVGAEPWIRAQDVEEIFLDQGEGWVFDLLRSMAERKPVEALRHLARLLSQGDHPLKLLGTIVGEVRRLLAVRQLIENELSGTWTKEMSYPQFQREVLQNGPPPAQNPYRYYMTFKNAENFTTGELIRALEWIHRTDQRLKSSGQPPRIAMERLILEMCQRQGQR